MHIKFPHELLLSSTKRLKEATFFSQTSEDAANISQYYEF